MSASNERSEGQTEDGGANNVLSSGVSVSEIVNGAEGPFDDVKQDLDGMAGTHTSTTEAQLDNALEKQRKDASQIKYESTGKGPPSDHMAESVGTRDLQELVEPIKNEPLRQDEPVEQSAEATASVEKPDLGVQTAQLTLSDHPAFSENSATRDPSRERVSASFDSPPPPPPKDDKFANSTGKAKEKGNSIIESEQEVFDEKHPPDESVADPKPGAKDDDNKLEIQSIMAQFGEDGAGPGMEEIMSPRLEKTQPVMFPPRSSSLDPIQPGPLASPVSPLQRTTSRESHSFNTDSVRPRISSTSLKMEKESARTPSARPRSIISPSPSQVSMFQPPPPSPEPEPDLPFDFHRFLEQLRHRTADPVARFLRSFLMEFGKKQWMVHEQVKIISDFLEFITKKMAQCEVWRTVSDAEFDNAREGMEKLVMNRLYSQTFSPAIPPLEQTPAGRTKSGRSQAMQDPHGPGRRGQHQEDVERDAVIAQKIRIYGWIKEEHLDMPAIGEQGRKFLVLAQQELLKINSYRAPRDKVICILNCCKVIFGFLKNNKSDQSADSFIPLLIYTVLHANPQHLVSNVQYIMRFRNQDKLGGEAGYYISSLSGVVTFVENLDRTNLTITDEEFERHVEASVSAIAEGHKADDYETKTHKAVPSNIAEKGSLARPEVTPRNSTDASIDRSPPKRNASQRLSGEKRSTSTEASRDDENVASGLLRTIQKPLSTIGRIFSEEVTSQVNPQIPGPSPISTPRTRSPLPPRSASAETSHSQRQRSKEGRPEAPRRSTERHRREGHGADDFAARQASAEVAEAQRIRAQEHRLVVE